MNGWLSAIGRFLASVYAREPWLVEFWSSLVLLLWATVAFSSDYDLQDSVQMRALSAISADGSVWATFCLLTGALQLWALIVERRALRLAGAWLASWFPSVVVISFIENPPITPSIAVYAGLAAMNLYSIARHVRRMA